MKGIILAGGTGSRLYPLTKVTNKHLLPVYNKPMIYYPLQSLIKAGIKEILIVSGSGHAGHFVNLLGSGKNLGVKLSYEVQDEAGGIAQALGLAESFVDEDNCVVILGDNIFEDDITPFVTEFENQKGGARLFLKEVDIRNAKRFGIALVNSEKVTYVEEKPENPRSNLAMTGLYMFDSKVFDVIKKLNPSKRGEYEITDAIASYLETDNLYYNIIKQFWSDAGTFSSLIKTSNFIKEKEELEIESSNNESKQDNQSNQSRVLNIETNEMTQKRLSLFKVHMPESVIDPLKEVLLSGYIGQGKKVEEFEELIGNYIGNKNVLTLNSCTSALQLALRLSNIKPGDEVITTAMTCTATNEPIMAMGAKIVWADINPTTGNIDPDAIRNKITNKTKAIIAMHWGGYPTNLKEINSLAKEYSLKVIEDAAHAFGSEYQGEKIGNHSDFICFSFQAIKHITTVDGGALLCKNEEDYKRGKLLRWYGIDREEKGRTDFRCENDIKEWGYKFHMNDVCAVIGIEQMKYINNIITKNKRNAQLLDEGLKNIAKLKLLNYNNDRSSAYWLYTLLVEDKERFMKLMETKGIMTSQVHARNDGHTMFKEFITPLPNMDYFSSKMVCIPVGWWISEEEVQYIINSIKSGW